MNSLPGLAAVEEPRGAVDRLDRAVGGAVLPGIAGTSGTAGGAALGVAAGDGEAGTERVDAAAPKCYLHLESSCDVRVMSIWLRFLELARPLLLHWRPVHRENKISFNREASYAGAVGVHYIEQKVIIASRNKHNALAAR